MFCVGFGDYFMSSFPLAFCEMIELLTEEPTGRIVKKVITRRYPHSEETYTYERYYLELPGQLREQLPPNFVKNYEMKDVQVIPETNGLKILFTPRK